MADQRENIDHQLSENVNRELEEQLTGFFREKTRVNLAKVIMDHEARLRELVLELLHQQIEDFNRQKRIILSTMASVAARRGVQHAVQPDCFQDLEPSGFQALRSWCSSTHSITASGPASPTALPLSPAPSSSALLQFDENSSAKAMSPSKLAATDDSISRKVHTAKRSGTQPIFSGPLKKQKLMVPETNMSDPAVQQSAPSSVPPSPITAPASLKPSLPSPTMRRSSLPTAAAASTNSTNRTMKNGDLLMIDVEANDFIFNYPAFGPGWFVLRCTRKDGRPVCFKDSPISKHSSARRHFNEEISCPGHDPTKKEEWTIEEMIDCFGHRVCGLGGSKVDDAWVVASNEKLRQRGGKGK